MCDDFDNESLVESVASVDSNKWIQYEDIVSNKQNNNNVVFTTDDMDAIQMIKNEPNLLRLMVASICPQILGHQMIKCALVLQLFGGVNKVVGKKPNMVSTRGSIHVLIVSDPGLQTNVLLKSVHEIAPNAQYVYGNACSATALTYKLALVKGSVKINNGFLMLADNGICCIEHFESLFPIHSHLVEPMESQTFTIIKYGIIDEIECRVSVLATANPINGLYERSKTIRENVKSNLNLNLFDLLFVLIDNPNDDNNNDNQLYSKLLFAETEENPDIIPQKLFKTYVLYARKYIHPVMSVEAKQIIREFGLEMRRKQIMRFNTSDLESLYRLTEARAKLELRTITTIDDANDAIDLYKYSMSDYNFDINIPSSTIAVPIIPTYDGTYEEL